jgi:uncharacterized protein
MFVYFIVALLATLIGSTAGMGGGVIIKPILDLLGDYNVTTIAILSSITVLSMALVSTIKQIRKGFKVERYMVLITIGAVIGGIVGSLIFSLFKQNIPENLLTAIQSAILIVLLLFCLVYKKFPKVMISSAWIQVLAGLLLGMLGSFLGIGGGPINVAVLCILFCSDIRNAARVSVLIILFSQISGLITKWIDGLFFEVQDFSMLLVMIPAAIIGGLLGATFNIKLKEKTIHNAFIACIFLVIAICIFNLYRSLV